MSFSGRSGAELKYDIVDKVNEIELTLNGVISLDEENLPKLIADKQFQQ